MNLAGNLFEVLIESRSGPEQHATMGSQIGLNVIRGVSMGHTMPPGTWHVGGDAGVMLVILSGEAGVLVDGENMPRIMVDGDYLLVCGRKAYRIEWTHPSRPTVWMIVQRSVGIDDAVSDTTRGSTANSYLDA